VDTKAYKIKLGKEKKKAVWQRRYWEHLLRDDNNFAKHFDTTHFNPVKQGYISKPRDWKWSSFHRYLNWVVILKSGAAARSVVPMKIHLRSECWVQER